MLMRIASLAPVLALFTMGCVSHEGGAKAAFSSTALMRAEVAAEWASCAGFAGAVHADSTCARYDQRSGGVGPLDSRVSPGTATARIACGSDLRLTNSRFRVDCASTSAHAHVMLLVLEDRAHPENEGTRHTLGIYRGAFDFIQVWVADRGPYVDFTVDYGVL